MSSGERAFPLYCPFCGDEDLRPHGTQHGVWECRSCVRVFSLKFVGLLAPSELQSSPKGLENEHDDPIH
jgi:transposase-like protein